MSPRPLGYATVAVLQAVADGHPYGFDIIDHTELASGTVYPALASLERRELVESRWEDEEEAHGEGRPRRRYYRITGAGEVELARSLERLAGMGLGRLSADVGPEPAEG